MSTAPASTTRPAAAAGRPHLTLVTGDGPRLAPSGTTGRQRLAALLAGLTSGFVMAAFAAALGGGDPARALVVAALCAAALSAVLMRARVMTVRARRRRALTRSAAARTGGAEAAPVRVPRAA